jgi:hypothetical protein
LTPAAAVTWCILQQKQAKLGNRWCQGVWIGGHGLRVGWTNIKEMWLNGKEFEVVRLFLFVQL